MVDSSQLKSILDKINAFYQKETDANQTLLWAKMATLEVSGWTEECIDELLNTYINSVNPTCKRKLLDKIKKVYGFHYSNDFRNICVQILGNLMFEKMQNTIPLECQQLESALNLLKENRDRCAHTHIVNKRAYDSPQISIGYLTKIEQGLKTFMKAMEKIKVK